MLSSKISLKRLCAGREGRFRDGLVAKNRYCCCRELRVCSPAPIKDSTQLTLNPVPRIWNPLLLSLGTCTHTANTHTQQQQLNKIKFLNGNLSVFMRQSKFSRSYYCKKKKSHPKSQYSKKFYVAQMQMYKKNISPGKVLSFDAHTQSLGRSSLR